MRFSLLFGSIIALTSSFMSCVSAKTFTNPLKNPNGSDPFMVYSGGYYYLLTTTWTDIEISYATTIAGLKTAVPKKVWSDVTASRSANMWAPEIHWINNRWYLYYSAGPSACCADQHPHVLEGGATPLDPFTYKAQLSKDWGIDGTILRFPNQMYFVWSANTPDVVQSLYIAAMTNPWTLGTPHLLSKPTNSWEIVQHPVNEGPAALYHGGKTWLTYSASYCWSDKYQLGLLSYKGTGDPLQASSWTKSGPVFSESGSNHGTGHNGFFTSPDGTEIWNVYHATADASGNCAGDRYTMTQRVNWDSNGQPNFGVPLALSTQIGGPSGEPS